jgi:hypothetical protein
VPCEEGTNMICVSSMCSCSSTKAQFWNGNICANVSSYLGECSINAGCNLSQKLICIIIGQKLQTNQCNFNKTDTFRLIFNFFSKYQGNCDTLYYWDSLSSMCVPQLGYENPCALSNDCLSGSGLDCDITLKKCLCLSKYYWSSTLNKCG